MFNGRFRMGNLSHSGFGGSVFAPGGMPTVDGGPGPESETAEHGHVAEHPPEAGEFQLDWASIVAKQQVETEALENYKRELVQEVFAVQQRVEQFIQSNRAARRGRLDAELEQVREEGRQQTQIHDRAQAEFYRADQERVESENGKRSAGNALREHRDRAPDRFASKAERLKHQRRDEALVKSCREADAEFAAALRARNEAAGAWEQAKVMLARLDQEAGRLEGLIEGKPFNDPVTGLQVRPSL